MLHLLLGRAGSGKTHVIRQALAAYAAAGEDRLFLLVPKQASFDNERALLRQLGPVPAQRVQVLSFSRLCDALARTYGRWAAYSGGSATPVAAQKLDDAGRAILMSLALEESKESLRYYRRSAQGSALVPLLLDASSEFNSCGIGPAQLREAARGVQGPQLRQKLTELAVILDCYDALVAQSWLDPQDDLDRAAACLRANPFFAGARVYIDGFHSFTRQQYAVLRALLRQAAHTTVALCADSLHDGSAGMGLFSIVKQTAASLMRVAEEEGVPVDRAGSAHVLLPGRRYRNPALAEVEARVFRGTWEAAALPGEGVHLYRAADIYDEVEYAAATIRRLLADGVCRARDIAVIARSMDPYHGLVDQALQTYEVPYFMDEARDISHEPLMRLLLCAFAVARSGFDTDELLTLVKTELTDVDADTAAALENYCFVWRLRGKDWRAPFTAHPEGFAKPWTGRAKAQLAQLEQARQRLEGPLSRFAAATADASGREIAAACWTLLVDLHVAAHLRELASSLERAARPALADDALRLWDLLMQVLDQCALVLGDRPMARARFEELLRIVLTGSNLAGIPQGVDEVCVGAADRIRVENPKIVFVLGAARGDFPRTPGTVGVLTFAERLSLIRGGLPLNDTLEGVDVQERFLAYAAVSAPSEQLYLSWPATDSAGDPKEPSPLVQELQAALLDCPVTSAVALPAGYFAVSRAAAFSRLARCWGSGGREEASLRALFQDKGDAPRLAALARVADKAGSKTPAAFADTACARELFCVDLRLSASQAETYALCPFEYFCKYGLGAKERRAADLDALEYGSLIHYLLEHLLREQGARALQAMDEQALRTCLWQTMEEYAQAQLGGLADKQPRFHFLLERACGAALVVVRHIAQELSRSKFVPVDFELPIGADGVPGLQIPLPDGGSVQLVGKVDRVDAWQEGGRTWLRVVDYKTGRKDFKLDDLLQGTNMQMLLYLAALCQNGGARYENPRPAGVLYMPALAPAPCVQAGLPVEKQRAEAEKELRMKGVVRADPAVIEAMEPGGKGLVLPVKLKAGEPGPAGSALTGPQLDLLLKSVQISLKQMGQALHEGKVPALPLQGSRHDACAWCPYAAVCGHETEDPVRGESGGKPQDVLRALEERSGESGGKVDA